MAFIDTLSEDLVAAMRAKDSSGSVPYGWQRRHHESRDRAGTCAGRSRITPGDLVTIQQRRDSIEQFQKGGREELAQKEADEITVVRSTCRPQLIPLSWSLRSMMRSGKPGFFGQGHGQSDEGV